MIPLSDSQATAALFPATFLTTYGIAVSLGHADSLWPYISDTGTRGDISIICMSLTPGTKPPESCIFGQFLNIGAFLLSVLFYIKYKQVHTPLSFDEEEINIYSIKVADFYPSHSRQKHLKKVNTISLGLGLVGALGVRFYMILFWKHLSII